MYKTVVTLSKKTVVYLSLMLIISSLAIVASYTSVLAVKDVPTTKNSAYLKKITNCLSLDVLAKAEHDKGTEQLGGQVENCYNQRSGYSSDTILSRSHPTVGDTYDQFYKTHRRIHY
jgi:hypothetical protein